MTHIILYITNIVIFVKLLKINNYLIFDGIMGDKIEDFNAALKFEVSFDIA